MSEPSVTIPPATDSESDTAQSPPDAEPQTATQEASLPVTGKEWQQSYRVIEPIGDSISLQGWKAARLDDESPVELRRFAKRRDSKDTRGSVRKRLEKAHSPNLQKLIEVRQPDIEVLSHTGEQTLREWRQEQKTLPISRQKEIIKQISEAIHALHQVGLAHLGISPQTISVSRSADELKFSLKITGSLAPHEGQKGLVAAAVDPYYAPPEAAGLYQHSPGEGLCAWDWWSLGRVTQYLLLGHHVLAKVLRRDVDESSSEFKVWAENLLKEKSVGDVRPGAVEAMDDPDPNLDVLLRGLLTASRDGRWGYPEIQSWLSGEKVKHYYTLPTKERLFRWKGRGYTIKDAADVLRRTENWASCVDHVFNDEEEGTFSHFIRSLNGESHILDRIKELAKMEQATTLNGIPPDLVHEAMAAIALMQLGRAGFIWRGHRVDEESIRNLLNDESDPDRLSGFQLISAEALSPLIESRDGKSAHLLSEVREAAETAESHLIQHRWLKKNQIDERCTLWANASKPPDMLRKIHQELKEKYARSTRAEINEIYQKPEPHRGDLALIAWTAANPAYFGYITHEEAALLHLAELREKGEKLKLALFWRKLRKPVGLGIWLFAQWKVWAFLWILLLGVGLTAHPYPDQAAIALFPLLFAALARKWLHRSISSLIKAISPDARIWSRNDGAKRCKLEANTLVPNKNARSLLEELTQIESELSGLKYLPERPAPIGLPPKVTHIWIAGFTAWLVIIGISFHYSWQLVKHPPVWPKIRHAWASAIPFIESGNYVEVQADAETHDALKALEHSSEEIDPAEKIPWPYRLYVGSPTGVGRVQEVTEATNAQKEHARERGIALIEPYIQDTINFHIAVHVPTETKFGLMLFSGRSGRVVGDRVFLLNFEPVNRTCFDLDHRKVIYLGK